MEYYELVVNRWQFSKKIFPKNNKTAGAGVLDGPFAWALNPNVRIMQHYPLLTKRTL